MPKINIFSCLGDIIIEKITANVKSAEDCASEKTQFFVVIITISHSGKRFHHMHKNFKQTS